MSIDSLVENYGYWVVFLGAMIEGESVILTASALAAMGSLSIWIVGIVTFFGTLIADQTLYFVGYAYGEKSLNYLKRRFIKLRPYLERGSNFLERHQTIYMLTFRFIYGIRIISPIIIGAHKISFARFSVLNLIAAFFWTVISCAIGYFLGTFLKQFTSHIEWIIFIILGGLFLIIWLVGRRKKS